GRAARGARDRLRDHEPGEHQLRRVRRLGLRHAARPPRAAVRDLLGVRRLSRDLDRAGTADQTEIYRAFRRGLKAPPYFPGIRMPPTGIVLVTMKVCPWVFSSAPCSHRYRTFTREISRLFVASGIVTSGPTPHT